MNPEPVSVSPRWHALVGRRAFLLVGLLLLIAVPPFVNAYLIYALNLALIYVLLAVGLNYVIGFAGQMSFANGALMGIGAYATGLLLVDAGWPMWLALPAGTLVATAIGLIVALPALRLQGLYLALGTVSFAQFALWVFIHWESVTYGNAGFVLPSPPPGFWGLGKDLGLHYLTLLIVVLLVGVAYRISRSRIGRAFIALRESEVAAQALAIDLTAYKTIAYGLSAFYAGLAGGLFTLLLGVVVPESFNLFQIIMQFSMVIIGGSGSIVGAILGAVTLVGLQEALRGFQEVQEIAFGALLLLTLLFFPSGIAGALKRWVPGWHEDHHDNRDPP
ncbi:MAG: branched-chain amino acid ABC transporter permease [Betaproteobacteria bacterium]